MTTRLVFLLLLTAVQLPIFAQNDTLTYELAEVIIAENRIQLPYAEQTRSIIVKSAKDIKVAPVISVPQMLRYIAGVDIRTRGANGVQADVGIRGGTFDQTLVLINGIKISDTQTGHHSVNLPLDLTNIDRIEVVKGPAARVYGQNAFSGAINIVTKAPEKTKLDIQLMGGDFALFGARLSGSIKKEHQDHHLSASYDRSNGYKYNTDYDILNIYYEGGADIGNGAIRFLGGVTNRSFGANGFYASPDFMDQYESVLTGLGAISYANLINQKIVFETRLYYRTNHDEYIFIRDNPDFYKNNHVNNTIGLEANTSIPNKLGVLGLGVDFNQVTLTSNNLGDRSRFVATMFVEHRFELLNEKLAITPGVQLNNYSDFGFNALPGVDIGYEISNDLSVFSNVGYTYRVPTFTDLYYEDPVNVGNPDLQPEYAWTYEIGLKTTRLKGVIAQASFFYRDGQNMIDWTRGAPDEPWQPVNLLNLSMAGFDSNFSFLLDKLTNNPRVVFERLDLNYTFINAQSTEPESGQSRYALENLRNQFSAGFLLHYYKYLKHSIYLSYYDRVNLPDYTLVDTRLSWDAPRYAIFVDITNIFNVEYKETNLVTMPGRWAKAGVRFSFYK